MRTNNRDDRDRSRQPDSTGSISIFNVALGVVIAGALFLLLAPPLLDVFDQPRRGRRSFCLNNMKNIALAMQNYHTFYGSLPPAYVTDEHGKPMHSWRVLLLPYLDQAALHRAYRFDDPWNSPHNRELGEEASSVFHCPDEHATASTTTSYVVVVGPHTLFPGANCTKFEDITDGLGETLLLVEVANSGIHWMEPRDLHMAQIANGQGISSVHPGGMNVFFGDGSGQFLLGDLSSEKRQAMLTIDGGEEIPAWDE